MPIVPRPAYFAASTCAPFVSGNHCRKISEIDSIPEIDLSAGRIAEVLKAAAKLNAENEQVILNNRVFRKVR